MTRSLDNPPHCKHKLVFRKEKHSAAPDSLWRNKYSSAITGRVNEARIPSLQMIFSRVSTLPRRNRNVCDTVSASETGSLPLARQPLPSPCHQPQSGCLLAAAPAGVCSPPQELLSRPSGPGSVRVYKHFQGMELESRHRRSVDCVLKLCLMFSPSKSEHVLGHTLEDDTNSGVAVTLPPHSTCVREGPEHGGSSSLIIQYCSRLFAN